MGNRLLLVDGDPRSLRVLDVSLRGAGFDVETAATGTEAWDSLQNIPPDLIIADTDLSEIDGFELCARLRRHPAGGAIPVILLSTDKTLQHKIRGLEAGASDYLVKPAYFNEVLARVRALLQRRDRERLLTGPDDRQMPGAARDHEDARPTSDRFAGSLADITVADLVQLVEGNGRSGIVHLRGANGAPASIYFRHGKVVDAEVGRLSGIDALSRLFLWQAGAFEVEWKNIRRKDAIERPSAELVIEGMQRLDDWNRLREQVPDLNAVVEVDYRLLAERLAEIPDEVNVLLRLCDGLRSIKQVVEDCPLSDTEALTAMIRLREEGILYETPAPAAAQASERSADAARFGGWLGARPSPSVFPTPNPPSAARPGIGSGPVQKSFADRLEGEARNDPDGSVATRGDATGAEEVEGGIRRRRTAPGLGQASPARADGPSIAPLGDLLPEAASGSSLESSRGASSEAASGSLLESSGGAPSEAASGSSLESSGGAPSEATSGSPPELSGAGSLSAESRVRPRDSSFAAQAIPEPRGAQVEDNIIKFPALRDSRSTSEPLGMAPPTAPPPSVGLTLPLGLAGQLLDTASDPAAAGAASVSSSSASLSTPAVPIQPGTMTQTNRGIGPSSSSPPAPETAVPSHVPEASSGRERQSGRVEASGRVRSTASSRVSSPVSSRRDVMPDVSGAVPSAQAAGARSGGHLVPREGENTVRVSFPDDDISRGDALDELGLPSRWRAMRYFVGALVVGALTAVAVHRLLSQGAKPEALVRGPIAENRQVDRAPLAPATGRGPVIIPSHAPASTVAPAETFAPRTTGKLAGPHGTEQEAVAVDLPSGSPRSGSARSSLDEQGATPSPDPLQRQQEPVKEAAIDAEGAQAVAKPVVLGVAPGGPVTVPAASAAPGRPGAVVAAPAVGAPAPPVPAPARAAASEPASQLAACRTAFARNRIREAVTACTAAVAASPNSAEALTMLAHAELNRGRMARANQLAQKAVTIDPNLADAYVIIGGVHQDSGQNRDAKAAYRRYLQLAPQGRYADELRSIVDGL